MQQRIPLSPSAAAARNFRLSVIAEDGTLPPATPPRVSRRDRSSDSSGIILPIQGSRNSINNSNGAAAGVQTSNRPDARRWTDKPPHHSADASPPGYQHWDDQHPLPRRRVWVEKVRGNAQIAKRGGWKRLVILLAILIALILALGIGLGVGLRNKNSSSNSSGGSSSTPQATPFPIGSYNIPVYSTQADTNCTSIPSTFLCYPYSIYTPSNPAASSATYNWIITAADSSEAVPSKFNISTSSNPFADMFSNIPLTLNNAGMDDEYYSFSLKQIKSVVPTTSLAPNGQTTECFYNNTILQAQLYTKKPSYNITSSSTGSTGQQSTNSGSNPSSAETANWISWPGAVNVTQSAQGGADVPNCYIMNLDGSLGARVTTGLVAQDSSKACVCGYRNFGF